MQTVVLSMEWSSHEHPDPNGECLHKLQRLLIRMMQGVADEVEAGYADQHQYPGGLRITSKDWQHLSRCAYVWMPFASLPLAVNGSPLPIAVQAYASYLGRCSHLFVLCPRTAVRSSVHSPQTRDFASWLRDGVFRFELTTMLMLSRPPKIALSINSSEGAMQLISPREPFKAPIGRGVFSCCRLGHVMMSSNNGVQQSAKIPCARKWVGAQTWELLSSHVDAQLSLHKFGLDLFRLWRAMIPRLMQGIPAPVPAMPATTSDFLSEFRFDKTWRRSCRRRSSMRGGSIVDLVGGSMRETGITPLLLAVASGWVDLVQQLIDDEPAQVRPLPCQTTLASGGSGN